jgi:hypothetical protein
VTAHEGRAESRTPAKFPRPEAPAEQEFEIGRKLKLDSNGAVRFQISDFGFEMQDSSNFKISLEVPSLLPLT